MFPVINLEVYKKAYKANQKVYRHLKKNRNIEPSVKDQLVRASLSIMVNISEGSGKDGLLDRRNYFRIARGSVFECFSIISFLHDEGEIPLELRNEVIEEYEEISKILYTMIKNLTAKSNR